ncbi:hypothetical protein K0J45_05655 [Shewanella alkalitolerans]|uniref:hypothetical protein n=1 Tax=Shewanella alkalitolerans TaxID=2864209 RepID=UPI001C65DB62|nr:hypothetical protein [Shewanella alkalitolerans]QYJ98725.1 hypothetical protein K0J45_05655 [Shewanella alkalitolerans]
MSAKRDKGKSMARKILLLIVGLLVLVLLAGVYRFNFTNDDLYVVKEDGSVIPLDEDVDKVMLTLFSIKTHKAWSIKLPESQAEARLTSISLSGDRRFASGDYQNGPERGSVHLDYMKIVTLNHVADGEEERVSDTNKDEMLFVAPFFVSNQGSGVFAYLGLFSINHKLGDIEQLDSYFIGDRVEISALQTEEAFDLTSSVSLSYLTHGDQQAMAEAPTNKVTKLIKVTREGFSE